MKMVPNLRFAGQGEAAVKLYQKVFGCKVNYLSHYEDANPEDNAISHLTPEQLKTCVYHCELEMAGNRVMLCDDLYNPPERGEMVSFNLCFEDVASARAAYDAMVEAGANVLVPAHEATFAAFVSSVVDPFGIRWGLMVER